MPGYARVHTLGFDKLATHLRPFTPEWAAELTWVPAEKIVVVARTLAGGAPIVLYSGNGQDNNINNYQLNRTASILRATRAGGRYRACASSIPTQ
jgi:formate dehydrogenase (coenzyme F420) alpha subunit